jgi:hypothetical protein
MALGGVVQKPTLLMAGEAGPEAIVPLGKNKGMGGVYIEHLEVTAKDLKEMANTVGLFEGLRQKTRSFAPA